MKNIATVSILLLACLLIASAQQPRPNRPPRSSGQSPASKPRLKSATPQTFTPEQVHEGQVLFGAQCGFCHGKDAAGGESGPDLTRSELVAKDVQGDKLGPVIHNGRPRTGMPAFSNLTENDLKVLVAFIHTQMDSFAELGGGRRSVEPEDLATGNAMAGREYFNGKGKCSSCHSPSGDLSGIASRLQGLNLLRRMLYPAGGFGNPAPSKAKATVVLPSGEKVTGSVAAEDQFTLTVVDSSGTRQTYQKNAVKFTIDDPLTAHFDQLGKYTDTDMHNVYAYLETLK
jgi:cytochrome c oxidase cbb3-type subunit 3